MTLKHTLITVLCCGHLALCLCGAMGWELAPVQSAAGNVLGLYGDLSGANSSFGFFAPGIAPQYRVRFTMTDGQGNVWPDMLTSQGTSEAKLRFGTTCLLLPVMDEATHDLTLRSFAATMFGRHRKAEKVTVRVELYGIERGNAEYDLPWMEEHRQGKKCRWLPFFETAFVRK